MVSNIIFCELMAFLKHRDVGQMPRLRLPYFMQNYLKTYKKTPKSFFGNIIHINLKLSVIAAFREIGKRNKMQMEVRKKEHWKAEKYTEMTQTYSAQKQRNTNGNTRESTEIWGNAANSTTYIELRTELCMKQP